MTDWSVEGDVLTLAGLVVVVQRIGLEDWTPRARMRSWGIAPLATAGGHVLVPCEENEALWFGLTCEEAPCAGEVRVKDELTGAIGVARLPDDYQLGVLSAAGALEPIRLSQAGSERRLELEVRSGRGRIALALSLRPTRSWCASSGRPPPPPLERPPVPPLLG